MRWIIDALLTVLKVIFVLLVVLGIHVSMGIIWIIERLEEWQIKRCLRRTEPNAVAMPFPNTFTSVEFSEFWKHFVEWAAESNIKIINIDSLVVRPLPKTGRYVIVKSIPVGNISPAFMLFLTKSDAVLYKLAFDNLPKSNRQKTFYTELRLKPQ